MSAIGHSVRLARIDVQRMLRKHLDWGRGTSSVVGTGMFAVLVLAGTVGGGYLGYQLGTDLLATGALPDIGQFTPIEVLRGILALFWLMITLVYTVRAVGQRGRLAEPEGVLTVLPTAEAVGGVIVAEFVYFLMWLLAPALSLGIGLAVGTGVLWPVVTVPLAVAAAGAASVSVAYPVGIFLRHTATRFEFVARHKTLLIVVVFVAYFAALSTGAWDRLMVALFEPMQQSPVGWYADLLFLGTPAVGASTAQAVGGLAVTGALLGVAVLGGTRIAERHWFSDPALAGVVETPTAPTGPGIAERLAPVLGGGTAALVTLAWRRAVRSPMKLLYAFYPVLLTVGLFANIVQTGDIPVYLPYAIVLFSAWAAGVIFTLNPLGDQGAVLPSTLLSRVDGATFVWAHLLAGLVVAVPIGTVATAAVALLSPVGTETVALLVVGTPVVMAVSAALSVGIGMAFPRFEATTVTKSMKTVLPSRWAFVLYSVHLLATVAAAAVVTEPLVRDLGAGLLTWALPVAVTPDTVFWVAAVLLVPLVLAPVAAYRYAVTRYDRYTLA